MTKKQTHFVSTWIDRNIFLATYRGLCIVKIAPRIMGRIITLNTHGYHTKTTSTAMNQAFQDSGLPWIARLTKDGIIITTGDGDHLLRDIEYIIYE